MKAVRISIANLLLFFATTSLVSAADSYSWTNFQSDIPGVATHTDPNLVNPWGMAVSSGGTIWVSDNGAGVSTLFHQDGMAVPLVVTIPTAARNKDGGNPTGVVFNSTAFSKCRSMAIPNRAYSSLSAKTVPFRVGTPRLIEPTRSSR